MFVTCIHKREVAERRFTHRKRVSVASVLTARQPEQRETPGLPCTLQGPARTAKSREN